MMDDSKSMPPDSRNETQDWENHVEESLYPNEMVLNSGNQNQKKASYGQPLTLPVFLLFLLVSAVLTVTIFAALVSPGSDGDEEHSRLQIDEVFPVLKASDNTTYTFDFVIFATNTEKGEAKNVEIQLAGVDYESKITYAIANTTIPKIPGERSQEAHVLITVPRVETYRIRIMVFENDVIELKGYSIVSPGSSGTRRDFRVDSFGPTYASKSDDESGSGSALTAISLVLFFVVLFVEVIAIGSSIDMTEFRSALGKISSNLRH